MFFSVNGYLLLRKKEITWPYAIHKIGRILLITLCWTLVIWLLGDNFADNPLRKYLGNFLQRGYLFQFCFFGSLIFLYATLLFLHYLKTQKYRLYIAFLIIIITISEVVTLLNMFIFHRALQAEVIQTLRLWTWYSYFMLGGVMDDILSIQVLKNFSKMWMSPLTFVFVLALPIYIYFVRSYVGNYYADYYYDTLYMKLLVILLFYYFKYKSFSTKFLWMIEQFSPLTMGIFVIHMHVLRNLSKWLPLYHLYINVFGIFCVLVISAGIVYVGLKLPIVRKLFVL